MKNLEIYLFRKEFGKSEKNLQRAVTNHFVHGGHSRHETGDPKEQENVYIVRLRGLSACRSYTQQLIVSSRKETIPYLDSRNAAPVTNSQGGAHRTKVIVGS